MDNVTDRLVNLLTKHHIVYETIETDGQIYYEIKNSFIGTVDFIWILENSYSVYFAGGCVTIYYDKPKGGSDEL